MTCGSAKGERAARLSAVHRNRTRLPSLPAQASLFGCRDAGMDLSSFFTKRFASASKVNSSS